MRKLYLLSTILFITAACVNASCPSVRGLSSPTNIVNAYVDSLFSDFSVNELGTSIQMVQILENTSQTKFKILLQVVDDLTGSVKSYIAVKSQIQMVNGRAQHRITSYLSSVSKSEIKKVFGTDFSFTHDNSCFEPKREFSQYFLGKSSTSEWFSRQYSGLQKDNKKSAQQLKMLKTENSALKSQLATAKAQSAQVQQLEDENRILRREMGVASEKAEKHLSVVMNQMLTTKEKNLTEITRLRSEIDMLRSLQADSSQLDQLTLDLNNALIQKSELETKIVQLQMTSQEEITMLKSKLEEKRVSESLLSTEIETKNKNILKLTNELKKTQSVHELELIKAELLAANDFLFKCRNELTQAEASKVDVQMKLEASEMSLQQTKESLNEQIMKFTQKEKLCLEENLVSEKQISELVLIIEENEKQIKQLQEQKSVQTAVVEPKTNSINEKLSFQQELEAGVKETMLKSETIKEQLIHVKAELVDTNTMMALLSKINLNLRSRDDISEMQYQIELLSTFFNRISEAQRQLLEDYRIQAGMGKELSQMNFNELETLLHGLRNYLVSVSEEERKEHTLQLNRIKLAQQEAVKVQEALKTNHFVVPQEQEKPKVNHFAMEPQETQTEEVEMPTQSDSSKDINFDLNNPFLNFKSNQKKQVRQNPFSSDSFLNQQQKNPFSIQSFGGSA